MQTDHGQKCYGILWHSDFVEINVDVEVALRKKVVSVDDINFPTIWKQTNI